MSEYPNYVFYPYHGDKYGFWIEIDDDRALSLFEHTPENGMWLDPTTDHSDYGKEPPSDALRELVAFLMTTEPVDMHKFQGELPEYESHFVSVIHGTINQHSPDSIPDLVWDWMNDCADEFGVEPQYDEE